MQPADSGLLSELEGLTLKPTEVFKFDDYAKKRAGRLGRPVKLVSNYFRLNVTNKEIYHYNIEITPFDVRPSDGGDKPKKIVKRKRIPKEVNFVVFDQLWSSNPMVFKSEPVFDGEKNIYSTTPLNFSSYEISFNVTITEDGDRKSEFKVRITTPDDSHKINLSKIHQSSSTDFKVTETQALDIILKNGPRRFKLNVGFNLFLRTIDLRRLDPNRQSQIRTYLGDNKEMAFGFYQSARMTEKGLMLNLDRAAIVFNQGGPIINILEKILSEARSTFRESVAVKVNANFRLEGHERKLVESEIRGLKVQINHIPYKPKFTIHRFSQEPISRVFFEETKANGSKVRTSVFDYFNRTYASWLQSSSLRLNPNLPAIQIGRDRPKYFPMEVCTLIDDQHSNKKLKAKLQAEMTRKAGQQRPEERFNEIRQNLKSVIDDNMKNGKQYLKQFGVDVDPNFVQVDSRILPHPHLKYRQGGLDPGNQGSWDMGRTRSQFLTSPDLGVNWAIVNVSTGRGRAAGCRPETLKDFAKALISKATEMGLKMSQPSIIDNSFYYQGRGSFERNLLPSMKNKNPNLRIMIVFIPKQDEIYHELKTVAELRTGLVTQCISQENERKCTAPAFVSNVLLKINAKIQGVNVILEPNSRPVLLTKCTMIVGLDVTHPAPADKLSQSIAACVGTYDRDFTKYYARVVVQPKPKKEIVDLAGMMTDLLTRFFETNKRLPSYIVIYRDGVSEGQFDEVMVKELGKLKEAFTKFEDGKYEPKIMFMVVQKRNHTRFMPVVPRDGSKSGNVQPGTLVDTTITSNVLFDFYLVAHAGMIGTSRPVHYYVLYDEIGAPADEIQKMTYYLSYLYPRCTKSISVPPPVMYAHLSAKRARSHIFIIDDSDGRSTVSSGSGQEYRQLSEQETQVLNDKLIVQKNLNGVLYYI